MDDLIHLMSIIDLNAKLFPEGDYLEACNRMKNLYKVIPRATSPEVFMNPIPIEDSDSDDDEMDNFAIRPIHAMRDELANMGTTIGRVTREIRHTESRLRYQKIRKRVTVGIKKDAIRERAQQLGIRLRMYTIEELRAKGHYVADERSFYKNYLERLNLITQDVITDLRDDLVELKRHHEELLERRNDLHIAIHGRPFQA